MTNSTDPDQLDSSKGIWIYTVCKDWAYLGMESTIMLSHSDYLTTVFLCKLNPLSDGPVLVHTLSGETIIMVHVDVKKSFLSDLSLACMGRQLNLKNFMLKAKFSKQKMMHNMKLEMCL